MKPYISDKDKNTDKSKSNGTSQVPNYFPLEMEQTSYYTFYTIINAFYREDNYYTFKNCYDLGTFTSKPIN